MTNARFGKIPTSFFAGDPSVDKFTREQEMLGYQFERNLTDDPDVPAECALCACRPDLSPRYIGNNWADINDGQSRSL